jgi:DNA-binding SARP family transcriptional activator/pimeloyl-ACP methyl ester carboxylesterase/tetratricopeptide (TPR) repeat protein
VQVQFELLGPLRVVEGGRDVTPARPKQRALLAMLLLHREEVVPGAQLIGALWGEEPPGTAQNALHGHVSTLRKLIGADRIRTRPPGYLLHVSGSEVDVARFEALVAQARARDDPEDRSACLREALALWRGEPLAELRYEGFAAPEIARLEELRLAAVEDRVDADLALGRHAELVPELEPLVAEHPFRERLRGQLMLALYRCGRQADALHVFRSGRRALVEELGIDPGPALQQLELRILRQDASLEAPTVAPTPAVRPPVRYTRSGDLNVAYQVTGDGPIDLVLISGFVSHLEKDWEEPRHARFLDRLGSVARLIRFDKRGTGLSDRPAGMPDLETRMDDVRAVMDAAGSERAVLFGYSESAPMAILFTATHPERVRALILYGAYAKRLDPDDDYPWAPTREARAAYIADLERDWGFESDMKMMCPSADEAMARWWGERCRAAASPGAIKALMEMNSLIDVRALLPTVRVPTLVVHRGTDYDVNVEEGRYIAERIPGARFVELAGADHFVAVDSDQILDVVEPFVAECEAGSLPADGDRALATLLVIDFAGSKQALATVRAELVRFRGQEVDSAGDGILATFDGPARAVRCATAIAHAVRPLGLNIRAGVHTGEVEMEGDRVRGVAVQIATRISAEAAPGEVLVSQTVIDLVAGSGLEFTDLGTRAFEGIPGERHLLAFVDDRAETRAGEAFIGRVRELGLLEEALHATASGTGTTVLVRGDAGIGKTRLASELAARARARGFSVLVGRCLDLVGTELPYQPFADALRPLVTELPWVDGRSQLHVFEETLAVLSGLAADAPVLLVLEDLHWADPTTLDLVVFLAHNVDERRVLLLGTHRADEPSSAERVQRLADGIRRSGSALFVELAAFGREEVAALLTARAGAPPPAPVTDAIVARSEGNPFFAEELLAAAGAETAELPHGLRDLLLRRIAQLDRTTRGLLRLAAAAGRDVDYPLLCAAAALSVQDVRESLRGAVEHGVLVADQATGTYRFRHALLAEAIYSTLLPGEREDVHTRLAEELVRSDAPAAELAPHWAAASRTREALVASIEAAREAEAVFGLAEALAHLERAIALWPDVPDAVQLTGLDLAELCSRAAELAFQTGGAPRGVALARQAIALIGDGDPVRAGPLHALLGRSLLTAGRRNAAVAAFERAVELVPPEPMSVERAEVLASFANALMLTWRHEESRAICEQALAVARAVGAFAAESQALTSLGVSLAYLGHGDDGLAALRRALQVAEQHGPPYEVLRAHTCLTDVLTMQGRPRESARLASEAVEVVRRYGVERSPLLSNQVAALLATGNWDDADSVSAAALRANTANWPHIALFSRAHFEIGRGDFDLARAHLDAARASMREDVVDRSGMEFEPIAVELALWQRRWNDAAEAVRDGLERRRPDDAFHRVQLCALGLRAQAELAAVARGSDDDDAVRGPLRLARRILEAARRAAVEAEPVTPNAAGWRALAEAEYERARGRARPEAWSKVAATWDRLERPPLAAYCHWRQAEALVAAGATPADAAVPLRKAHAVAARIGARPLLQELGLLAERAGLAALS